MVSFSVANINPGSVRAEFMASILNLVEHERKTGGEFIHPEDEEYGWVKSGQHYDRIHFGQFYSKFAGPYLDTERNVCVQWFLNACVSDYLLFIDSDIAFRPEQAYELCRIAHLNNLPLIGGVYYNALDGIISPLAYLWRHDDTLGQRNLKPIPQPAMESMAGVSPFAAVDAMGAGFMLISRELLNAMTTVYDKPTPWFAELDIDGIQMGEDFTFCVRAAAIGYQPYIAPGIIVDHYKVCLLRQAPSVISVSSPPADNNGASQEKVH